ncbi:Spore germination GerAB [Acididesulfobacillus acetoxydans]|uniref:Spore germination GerAB n=1 Tax=Acididesulfobacillus acetoxydans TaxID=1561005 RepID=A0A8S0X403_9FIRM|nr:endospore germination permease [Acididesulfobacillus acetoxydans]CAA7600470.1 Spore germination GerAB [Acididesulfobacillus acetoxydans]CEJ06604.1 Spore germination protein [Acididesulfobacillus acetoxydans]
MESGRISERQLVGLIVVSVLATGLIYVPSSLLANSGRDAYLVLPLSAVLGLPAVWLIGSLCQRCPRAGALALFTDLLGKPLGTGVALAYVGFFFITVLTIVDPGGAMIRTAFMPDTPMLLLVFLLTALAGYGVYLGLETLARFNAFVMPPMFLTFVVLALANYNHFNFDHLLPPLEHGLDPVWTGVVDPVGWFTQIILVLFFIPEVRHINRRTLLSTVIINTLAFEFLILIILATMGAKLPSFYEFPTLELARIATFGGSVRGYDALIMTVWVTAVSLKVALWLYAGLVLLGDIFRLQNRGSLLPPLIVLISITAYAGVDNIWQMSHYGRSIWPHFALPTFEVGIPFLLYVISLCKRRRRASGRGGGSAGRQRGS